jgi:hypothetical protein
MLNVDGRPFLDTLIDEIARYNAFDEILLAGGPLSRAYSGRYAGAVVALEQEPPGTARTVPNNRCGRASSRRRPEHINIKVSLQAARRSLAGWALISAAWGVGHTIVEDALC